MRLAVRQAANAPRSTFRWGLNSSSEFGRRFVSSFELQSGDQVPERTTATNDHCALDGSGAFSLLLRQDNRNNSPTPVQMAASARLNAGKPASSPGHEPRRGT